MFMDISYRIRITVLKTNEMNCLYTLEFFNNFELSSVQFHFCFFFSLSLLHYLLHRCAIQGMRGGVISFSLCLTFHLLKKLSSLQIQLRRE